MTVAAWVQDSTGGAPGRLGYHSARSWRHAGVTPSRQNDAAGSRARLCITRMLDGRTQHHAHSAGRGSPCSHALPAAPAAPADGRPAIGAQQHLRKPSPTTSVSPTVTMRSASTVDAAIERTCAGDAHGPQAAVSAIGRGRWGRWQRVRARTAAALRNARERSVWVLLYYSTYT